MLADRYDLPLSTADAAARDAYVQGSDLALTLYPGAIEAFDRAIAADPGFALAHAGKAQVLMREGNVTAARAALSAAKEVAAGLPAREHKIEETDVTSLALRQTDSRVLGRPQGHPCCRDVALSHQYLGLTGMGQGKTGVGGDGAVKGLDRAWVKGQRQIAALDVGVTRRLGVSAQSEVVSVCQHIEYSRALLKI